MIAKQNPTLKRKMGNLALEKRISLRIPAMRNISQTNTEDRIGMPTSHVRNQRTKPPPHLALAPPPLPTRGNPHAEVQIRDLQKLAQHKKS